MTHDIVKTLMVAAGLAIASPNCADTQISIPPEYTQVSGDSDAEASGDSDVVNGDVDGGDTGTELAQYCEPCDTMEACETGACVDYNETPTVEGFCFGTPQESDCSHLESAILVSSDGIDYCASTNACGTLNPSDGGSADGDVDAGDVDGGDSTPTVVYDPGTLGWAQENLCSDGTAYVSIPVTNAADLTSALAYTVNGLEDGCEGSGQGIPSVTGTLEGNVPTDAKEIALGIDDAMTDSYCLASEEQTSGNYKVTVIGKDASSVQAGVENLFYEQQENIDDKCE